MTTDTKTAGPCACGRFQSFPAALPPIADGTMHVPVLPTPPLCEVIALGQERVRLTAELAATISCGHAGTDSACLECLACERYDRASSGRRLKQLEEDLALAHQRLSEWRESVKDANRISQGFEERAMRAELSLDGARSDRSALLDALTGLVEWGARGHNPHDIAPWIRATQILKDARASQEGP